MYTHDFDSHKQHTNEETDHMKYCRRVLLGTKTVVYGYLDIETGTFFLDKDGFRRRYTLAPGLLYGYKGPSEPVTLENPVSGKRFSMIHVEVEPKPMILWSRGAHKWMVEFNHNWYEAANWRDALGIATSLVDAHYCLETAGGI